MLMVTSSMRMLDGVHSNTSDSWPVVSLSSMLEPRGISLKEGLVGSLTSSDDSNHSSATSWDGLSGSGGESDSGLSSILGMSDDDGGASRGSGETASVTHLGFTVRNNGSLRKRVNWEDVSDGEGGYRKYVKVSVRRI